MQCLRPTAPGAKNPYTARNSSEFFAPRYWSEPTDEWPESGATYGSTATPTLSSLRQEVFNYLSKFDWFRFQKINHDQPRLLRQFGRTELFPTGAGVPMSKSSAQFSQYPQHHPHDHGKPFI